MNEYDDTTVAQQADRFLNDMIEAEDPPVRVSDIMLMIASNIIRLRSVITLNDLDKVLHHLMQVAEERLQRGVAIMDPDTGEYINMVLAEEVNTILDMDNPVIPDAVPEEWLE